MGHWLVGHAGEVGYPHFAHPFLRRVGLSTDVLAVSTRYLG